MSLPDFSVAAGDTAPSFVKTWTDEDGNEVDLTDWAVTFSMQDQGRVNPPITGDVTVTDTVSGVHALMTYDWAAGNTDVPALYDAEFTATKDDATMTWPIGRQPPNLALVIEVRPHV
jgi:hypothetical protein